MQHNIGKMEIQTIERPKRSEALTAAEQKALAKYRKEFDTEVSCALAIGIDRSVLNAVLLKGSGRPDTVEKIRGVLRAAKLIK